MYDILECARHDKTTSLILDRVYEKFEKGQLFYKDHNGPNGRYWYPSLNSGLPEVKKADPVHCAAYAFHDFTHTCLYDPLPDVDRKTYIIGKMVGEAMALIFSDGIFTGLVRDHMYPQYPFEHRKYLPMYDAVKHKGIRDIAIATSHLAIHGDIDLCYDLCDGNNDAYAPMISFIIKYGKMFDADLWWNDQVYNQFDGETFGTPTTSNLSRNNITPVVGTIEECVDLNLAILANTLHKPGNGDGIKLAKELTGHAGPVFEHISVSYSKSINDEILNEIRGKLL